MLKGIYDETDRYWLDGYSFVDTKTDRCLNFGLKDLVRVTVVLNNQEYFLNLQDEQIKDLKNELIKECKEHQEAMQIADKRIKELENENADLSKTIEDLKQQLAEKEEENLALAHIITDWDDYNQEKIEFAIEQLEKVKARFNGKRPIDEMANDIGVELGYTATQIQNYIANLQDQLKTLTKNGKVFSSDNSDMIV